MLVRLRTESVAICAPTANDSLKFVACSVTRAPLSEHSVLLYIHTYIQIHWSNYQPDYTGHSDSKKHITRLYARGGAYSRAYGTPCTIAVHIMVHIAAICSTICSFECMSAHYAHTRRHHSAQKRASRATQLRCGSEHLRTSTSCWRYSMSAGIYA